MIVVDSWKWLVNFLSPKPHPRLDPTTLALARDSLQDVDLNGLAIYPSPAELDRALESWDWIHLGSLKPILVNAFGDIFFEAPSGGIVVLDMIDGRILKVADNRETLCILLNTEDGRDKWLFEGLVLGARARGQSLKNGECYDFEVAPVLGGPMDADHVSAMSFVVKVHLAGQIHRQVAGLPDGNRISGIEIKEEK